MTRRVLRTGSEKMKGSFVELLGKKKIKKIFPRLKGSVEENETQVDLEMTS